MNTPSSTNFKIGILGGKGLLGGDLVSFFGVDRKVFPIDRDNYDQMVSQKFDLLINANGNSKRFWANEHPLEDFEASTFSVYKSLRDFQFKKYLYISSSDVYPNHEDPSLTKEDQDINPALLSPYGFHKYLSEKIVQNRAADWVILRSSLILGEGLKKGPFYDIMTCNPLFITLDSQLQIITTQAVAQIIEALLSQSVSNKVFNVGGKGTFSFLKTSDFFPNPITVSDQAKPQVYKMNVEKISDLYPLKTSEEYLKDFLIRHGKKV